jgi:hypothetical protein
MQNGYCRFNTVNLQKKYAAGRFLNNQSIRLNTPSAETHVVMATARLITTTAILPLFTDYS